MESEAGFTGDEDHRVGRQASTVSQVGPDGVEYIIRRHSISEGK